MAFPEPIRSSGKPVGYLDGLRGLAALIVIFAHCSNAGIDVIPMLNLSYTGKIGVWLFFVLSAFLLAGSLVRDLADRTGATRVIAAYAARRLFRILPAYFVFLFAATALGFFRPAEALWHALLIEGRDHLWTIPVEMAFYAILPIIALALSRCAPRYRLPCAVVVMVAAIPLYIVLAPQAIRENSIQFSPYALFFTLGILVSQCRLGPGRYAAFGITVAAAIAILLSAPRSAAFLQNSTPLDSFTWSWVAGVAWAAFLFALTSSKTLRFPFGTGILCFYGRISFSLYLTHYYIVDAVATDTTMPPIVKGVVAIGLATVVATGLHLAVEVPGMKVGARLSRRIVRGENSVASFARPD